MAISDQQVQQYFDDGFLIVENLLTTDDLQPVMYELEQVVDEWAEKLYRAGKISHRCAGEDLFHRLTKLEEQWPGAAPLVHNREQVRPALARLWSSDKILGILERFLGPRHLRASDQRDPAQDAEHEIDDGSVAPGRGLFHPGNGRDAAAGRLDPVPGHESGERQRWRWFAAGTGRGRCSVIARIAWSAIRNPGTSTSTRPTSRKAERVTCEMKVGSVLFHNTMMPHRSTENYSDRIRWSADLRWQRPGEPAGFDERPLVPMRKGDDPDFRLDISQWAQGELDELQAYRGLADDSFEYSCTGPWLDRWEDAA